VIRYASEAGYVYATHQRLLYNKEQDVLALRFVNTGRYDETIRKITAVRLKFWTAQ
jgi:hypothetical protein